MVLGCWSVSFGQNIVAGEYFIDNVTDFGTGTEIEVDNPGITTSVSLNLNNEIIDLPDGLHRLFFRFKDSNGLWSHTFSYPVFVKHSEVINIVAGEYFFDEKVDYGDGIPIDVNTPASDITSDIILDTTIINLPDGLHRMFFRFKDNNELWSHTFSRPVFVKHHEVITIVAGEYFIDEKVDYGEGDSIDVANMESITHVVDCITANSNLTAGDHDLFFRFKDSNGLWSHTFFKKEICTGVVTGTYSMDNTNYCAGETVSFNYSSAESSQATYSWDLDNDGDYDDQHTNGETLWYVIPDNFSGTTSIQFEAQSSLCSNWVLRDTFTFEVHPTYNYSVDTTVCSGNNFTLPDGTTINDINEPFSDTSFLQTMTHLCDSIIIINVDVAQNYDIPESDTICYGDNYTFPDGTTENNITSTVVHESLFQTEFLCDSIIETTVIPYFIDTSVVETGNTLTANEQGASYQWLDCDNGNAEIPGETNQSFTPVVSGNYAVEITQNGCIESSECHQVIIVGTDKIISNYHLSVYPNPFTDQIQIHCDCAIEAQYFLYDQLGRLIKYSEIHLNGSEEISTSIIEKGLYFILIRDSNSQALLFKKMIVKIL